MVRDDDRYRQLVINTPFNQQLFLMHSEKFKLQLWKPFEIIPVEFVDLMGEYAIEGDEVKVVWKLYGDMVYKMIDGEYCRIMDQKTL